MTMLRRLSYNQTRQDTQSAPRSTASVLVGGFIAALSGTFATRVLGIAINILLARELGRLLYGEYASLMALLAILASMMGLGLDTWLMQEGGRNPAGLANNVSQVILLKLASAIGLVLIVSLLRTDKISLSGPFLFGLTGIIFDSFSQTGYAVLRTMRRNGTIALVQTAAALLLLSGIWLMSRTVISVAAVIALQAILSIVVALALLRITRMLDSAAWRHIAPIPVVKKAWLFVVSDLLSNVYNQCGLLILSATAGAEAVGLFRPALTIIWGTFMVPTLIFLIGLPMLSASMDQRSERNNLIRLMSLAALIYGGGLLVIFLFAGSPLLRLIFGSQYHAAAPFIQAMSLIPLFKSASFVCVAVMIAYQQQRIRAILQAAIVLLSVGAGLWLIPRYGLESIAWFYLGMEALLLVFYLAGAIYVVRRHSA